MAYRYTVLIERGDDPGVYVVSVPSLPGCFTQGNSIEQALEHARDAIAGHVAALTELGEPVPIETEAPLVTAVDVDPAA